MTPATKATLTTAAILAAVAGMIALATIAPMVFGAVVVIWVAMGIIGTLWLLVYDFYAGK